jgi:toxin HigB-1
MIRSVKGSATRRFIEQEKSRFSGLDVELARQRLSELNAAPSLDALGRLNSVGLHKLKGSLRAYWSIDVNGRWRILFKFQDGHAYEVHIIDPH